MIGGILHFEGLVVLTMLWSWIVEWYLTLFVRVLPQSNDHHLQYVIDSFYVFST